MTPVASNFALQNLAGDKLNEMKVGDKSKNPSHFIPLNLFDCVYGCLHNPNYRKKFSEFLKTDFPRILFPKDAKRFFAVAEIGKNLREIHLLESLKLDQKLEGGNLANFPIAGSNKIEKVVLKKMILD